MGQEISNITAVGLVITLFLGLLMMVLPRRYALVPMLIGGCYMPLGQVLVIGGLNFYLIRIIIFFGMIRIVFKREIFSIKMTSIDKVFIAWLLVNTFLYVIFSGSYGSFTERLGGAYNAFGIYFIIRALVRSFEDIVHTVKMLSIIVIPLAFLFAVEYKTGVNHFSILGGPPIFPEIRDGLVRSQGPFLHSILAGTFGATAMPLFVGLWVYSTRNRLLATGAILSATIIVVTSSSSGPLLAYLAGSVGLICWTFKYHMIAIRWGIVIVLLYLHVYMNTPVWFLISKLGDVVGGGGWYRSALIDASIRHFDEWWLIGTGYTAHWMPTGLAIDPNSADITNYFISHGIKGGILSLILFIWLIVKCFKITGTAVHSKARFTFPEKFMIWSLGCTVLSHVTSFFSVSYFDQIIIFWYLVIAMIAVIVHDRNDGKMTMTEPHLMKDFHNAVRLG